MKVLIKTPSQSFIRSNSRVPENNGISALSPVDGLYEYLLVLRPYGFLRHRIIEEKKHFFSTYKNFSAILKKPHITLANFLLPDYGENEVIGQLKLVSENQYRVKVIIKDYQWFPHHTMYLDILYQADIRQLIRKITDRTVPVINRYSAFPPRFILDPHLTICKDLSVEQYEHSSIEYYQKKFSGDFTAKGMILLKRPVGESNRYDEIHHFTFRKTDELTARLKENLYLQL